MLLSLHGATRLHLTLIYLAFPPVPVDGLSVLNSKASPLRDPIPIYLFAFFPPAILPPTPALLPPLSLHGHSPPDYKHLSKTFP